MVVNLNMKILKNEVIFVLCHLKVIDLSNVSISYQEKITNNNNLISSEMRKDDQII